MVKYWHLGVIIVNKKVRVHSLYEEFLLVQIEDYVNRSDEHFAHLHKAGKRRLLMLLIPYITSCGVALCTLNPTILAVGNAIFGVGAIICTIKDNNEQEIRRNSAYIQRLQTSATSIPFPDYEFDFSKPIITKKHEDYYREEYKEYLASLNSNEKPSEPPINVVFPNLSKDEAMRQIVYEYDVLNSAYKLPPMAISDADWELLFDIIYKNLDKKKALYRFYEYMRVLTRYALASSLIHEDYEISLLTYLKSLPIMEKVGFPKINIKRIKKVINKTKGYGKVLTYDFASKQKLS